MHDQFIIAVYLGAGHGEEGVGAPHEACHGAEGHQRVHIGRAVDEALETADEELLVDDHDDACQQQLDKAHGNVVAVEPVRQGPAPHHMAHGEVHQYQQEAQRGDEPPFEFGRLVVGQCIQVGAGISSLIRCVLGAGTITGLLHRRDDGGRGGSALHAHRVGQKAHRAARDARHLLHGLFHPGRAGRAAHACDIILFHCDSFL